MPTRVFTGKALSHERGENMKAVLVQRKNGGGGGGMPQQDEKDIQMSDEEQKQAQEKKEKEEIVYKFIEEKFGVKLIDERTFIGIDKLMRRIPISRIKSMGKSSTLSGTYEQDWYPCTLKLQKLIEKLKLGQLFEYRDRFLQVMFTLRDEDDGMSYIITEVWNRDKKKQYEENIETEPDEI